MLFSSSTSILANAVAALIVQDRSIGGEGSSLAPARSPVSAGSRTSSNGASEVRRLCRCKSLSPPVILNASESRIFMATPRIKLLNTDNIHCRHMSSVLAKSIIYKLTVLLVQMKYKTRRVSSMSAGVPRQDAKWTRRCGRPCVIRGN